MSQPLEEPQLRFRAGDVARIARQTVALGLNRGTAGNVSSRSPGGMWVTATGLALAQAEEADVVELSLGRVAGSDAGMAGTDSGRTGSDPGMAGTDFGMAGTDAGAPGIPDAKAPSSEWRLHAAIYASRPECGAVVHTHSPYASALACLRADVPAFHYMIAAAGGSTIRCAAYALFGSAELGRAAVEALRDRRACLLANHGAVALGADPDAALAMAVELEELAHLYWLSVAVGQPAVLSEDEMTDVLDRFESYRRGR